MILFLDVDGCLNSPDGSPLGFTPETLTATQKADLAALGSAIHTSSITQVVLNTGRSWLATHFLYDEISSPAARYALVEHGAELWDTHSAEPVDPSLLTSAFSDAAASIARVRALIEWYTTHGADALAHELSWHEPLLHQADKRSNVTIRVPKELDGDELMDKFRTLIERRFPTDRFEYHHSRSDGFIDVMGQVDKGMGVQLALTHLQAPHLETAGIGNGLNDLPMLEAVDLPICPSNAEPEVKAYCAQNGLVSEHAYIQAATEWLRG